MDATWETDPRGISVGGWGLSIRTEEIARFGELYRRRGVWDEQTVVPGDWVDAATRAQVSNGDQPDSDWQQGYGYQFWRCRHGAYRADGAFGQFCVVMPEQEAVFVTTANVDDLQGVLDLLWDKLLPAMTMAPLPPDAEEHETLLRRLSELKIAAPEGSGTSGTAGVSGRTYQLAENEQGIEAVTLEVRDGTVTLNVKDAAGTHKVIAGIGDWRSGTTTFLQSRIDQALPGRDRSGEGQPVAACAAWIGEDNLTLRLCLIETPFTPTVVCTFVGDNGLRLAIQGRIGFGPSERPVLEGIAP